jgi:DNA-binding NtrC family response regulator
MIRQERFRQDLYYRINVVRIELPPLRVRGDDIGLLAEHFATRHSREMGKPTPSISPEAYQVLRQYPWPGNVRELQNAIEYGVVLARQNLITVKELPAEVQLPAALQKTELGTNQTAKPQSLDEMERNAILQALAQCHGNKKKAAQLLGIQRPTLYNKMKRYGIEL